MLENLALRQQLAVFKRQQPRPRLGAIDKLFWVVARRFWAQWKKALVPTVVYDERIDSSVQRCQLLADAISADHKLNIDWLPLWAHRQKISFRLLPLTHLEEEKRK